jgi:hypothetical protein
LRRRAAFHDGKKRRRSGRLFRAPSPVRRRRGEEVAAFF